MTALRDGRSLGWDWVARCRVLGGTATLELFREAVDAGEAAVALMVDVLSRRELREGRPSDCALIPVHAVRVLEAIGSEAAIPALVGVLADPVDPGLHGDEAAIALGRLGRPALAPLEGLLFDARRDPWVRVAAARGLLFAALANRTLRPRVRSSYERLLGSSTERDRSLVAHVVASACLMAAGSLLPAIDAAFAAGRVDEDIIAPESARIDLLTRRHRPDPDTKAIARRDPAEDYVEWAELARGMDPEERARLEARLAHWAAREASPPEVGDELDPDADDGEGDEEE